MLDWRRVVELRSTDSRGRLSPHETSLGMSEVYNFSRFGWFLNVTRQYLL
jgi:hypothetical protein